MLVAILRGPHGRLLGRLLRMRAEDGTSMATFHFDLVSPGKARLLRRSRSGRRSRRRGRFRRARRTCAGRGRDPAGDPDGDDRRHAAEDHRARRSCRSVRQGPDRAGRCRDLDRRSWTGPSSPTRFPRWKPSSPKRKARSSTARSSGSIISRASRTSSIRRRCTSSCSDSACVPRRLSSVDAAARHRRDPAIAEFDIREFAKRCATVR